MDNRLMEAAKPLGERFGTQGYPVLQAELARLRRAVERAVEILSDGYCVHFEDMAWPCPKDKTTHAEHWRDYLMREDD